MKRVTIIGGGASGTLLAVNLMRQADGRPVEINFVENRSRMFRGVAFGTTFESHLLNVPASKMGAFPDNVEHFHGWLEENGHSFTGHDFVPRRIFGEYLQSVFADAETSLNGSVRLNQIDGEATDISIDGATATVTLRSGETLVSDAVVLAFGNFSPPQPYVADLAFASSERYFQNPWSSKLYESIGPDDSIFIIGTGLSMIDVVMHLYKHDHRGKIDAISTRGLLPAVHELGHTYPAFNDEIIGMERITDIFKTVRRHIQKAESDGSNWRAVIDSLRPATQQLWRDLPTAEKQYFRQHLSRYWNIARHRMPPEAAAVLTEMQNDGRLEILKGRLKTIENLDDGFAIGYSADGTKHSRTTNILVNCIGSETDFSKLGSDLVRNMIASGHIRNDELRLGLDATADGHIIDGQGRRSNVIFTLGTALKGILWETTSIPEIRTQAHHLALKLLTN